MHHLQPKPWMDARREAARWRIRIDRMADETGRLGLRGRATVASRLSRLNALHAQAVGLLIVYGDELSTEGSSAGKFLECIWRRSAKLQELLREEVRAASAEPALKERDEHAFHGELQS